MNNRMGGFMQIASGVEMLELPAILMNSPGMLYPTVMWDERELLLFDAGLPDMAPVFREAMAKAHIPLEKLSRIIITHHDLDHIGSLRELRRIAPGPVEVISHTEEVPYVQGERLPIKMTPGMREKMAEQMKDLSEEQIQAMQSAMKGMQKQSVKVDRAIEDGEILPVCGGIRAIHTPGHTPGHTCFYLQATKTLVAGDALFVEEGKLCPAPPFINADTGMAYASLKKLSFFDLDNVIAYHGGLFCDNPNRRIVEILSEIEQSKKQEI